MDDIKELTIWRTYCSTWIEEQEPGGNAIMWERVNIVEIGTKTWKNSNLIEEDIETLCFLNPNKEIKTRRSLWGKIKFWCSPVYSDSETESIIDTGLCTYHYKGLLSGNKKIVANLTKEEDIYKFLLKIVPTILLLLIHSNRTSEEKKEKVRKWLEPKMEWMKKYKQRNK